MPRWLTVATAPRQLNCERGPMLGRHSARQVGLALLVFLLLGQTCVGSRCYASPERLYDPVKNRWSLGEFRRNPAHIGSALPLPRTQSDPGNVGLSGGLFPNWEVSPNHPISTPDFWVPIGWDVVDSPQGGLWAVWSATNENGPSAQPRMWAAHSQDRGASWSDYEQVDSGVGYGYRRYCGLAVTPSGTPIVAWDAREADGRFSVYFSKRVTTESGSYWTPQRRINTTGSPPDNEQMDPVIGAAGDLEYYVAWTDHRHYPNEAIYLRGTTDGGATWLTEAFVSETADPYHNATDPELFVIPGSAPGAPPTLYCATTERRDNNPYPDVYFYSSTDRGVTWADGVRVNDVTFYSQQTTQRCIAASGQRVIVGWEDGGLSTWHSLCSTSEDGGRTWSASTNIDGGQAGTDAGAPCLLLVDDLLFAAYTVSGPGNNFPDRTVMRVSFDQGISFSGPALELSEPTGEEAERGILAGWNKASLFCLWRDIRDFADEGYRLYAAEAKLVASGAEEGGSTGNSSLLVVYPNPAASGKTVTLAASPWLSSGCIRVLDVQGRMVSEMALRGGPVTWTVASTNGSPLRAGTYFLQLLERPPTTPRRHLLRQPAEGLKLIVMP